MRKPMFVLGSSSIERQRSPKLTFIGTVGVRRTSLDARNIAFVVVAVVLSGSWRLWIKNDGLGSDTYRLVKALATLWAAVADDLNFLSGSGASW